MFVILEGLYLLPTFVTGVHPSIIDVVIIYHRLYDAKSMLL